MVGGQAFVQKFERKNMPADVPLNFFLFLFMPFQLLLSFAAGITSLETKHLKQTR